MSNKENFVLLQGTDSSYEAWNSQKRKGGQIPNTRPNYSHKFH